MNTHGTLTEHSRSYQVVTPDRKGREGKGREVGHLIHSSHQPRERGMDGGYAAEIGGGR